MGQDTRSIFQYLKDAGYEFLIAGMHVKGQVIDSKGVAGWGYGGQTVQRGDWVDGAVSDRPADLANAWKKQTVLCEHELPGTARHDPLAYLQNRTVDWLDHQLAARELLDSTRADAADRRARVRRRTCRTGAPPAILAASIAFTRHIDRGGVDVALQAEVFAAQGIPVQGVGRRRTGADVKAVFVVGTLDTDMANWEYVGDSSRRRRRRCSSTSEPPITLERRRQADDVSPTIPDGAEASVVRPCGEAVGAMSVAFEAYVRANAGVAGIIGIGRIGRNRVVTPAMRAPPVGVPKVMVSTVASERRPVRRTLRHRE